MEAVDALEVDVESFYKNILFLLLLLLPHGFEQERRKLQQQLQLHVALAAVNYGQASPE